MAAVVMQACLGATYSWSVYVHPLRELTGLAQGPVQSPFTLFYFAFPGTMIFGGAILKRLGPRGAAMLGGLLFGGGWLLASQGSHGFPLTIAGIGLVAGVGAGMAYIVPIATCIKWFPAHQGLVTGIAVAGFGGGAALVSQIGGRLMAAGATPFSTFAVFGVAFLVLILLAGSQMANPPQAADAGPEAGQAAPPALTFRDVAGRPVFQVLYLAMLIGLAAGFAVNANIKELYPSPNLTVGIAAVSLFSVANALGRVLWGMVFDRLAAWLAITANLLGQAVVLAVSPLLLTSDAGLLILAFLCGFHFGGVLVLYASASARLWGEDNVGQVYGLLFSSNIPAALAPMAAGFVFDATGGFTAALYALAGLLVVMALAVARLRGRLAV